MVNSIIQNILLPKDSYIWGTADLNKLIDKKFVDYQYGISIGKRLDDKIIDSIANGPTVEYYEHYNQINKELAKQRLNIDKRICGICVSVCPIGKNDKKFTVA